MKIRTTYGVSMSGSDRKKGRETKKKEEPELRYAAEQSRAKHYETS